MRSHSATTTRCARWPIVHRASREQGAFQALPEALDFLGLPELRIGSLNVADVLFTEVLELQGVLRREGAPSKAARLIVLAWRDTRPTCAPKRPRLRLEQQTFGLIVRYTEYALMLLELSLGNYQAASELARDDWYQDLCSVSFGPPTPSRPMFAATTPQARGRARAPCGTRHGQ